MIEIIQATTADIALIQQLAKATFFATYLPLQPAEKVNYLFDMMYTRASLQAQMIEKRHRFILVKDESTYLGYASYELNSDQSSSTKIHKIYVMPNAQGKGVGKAMINHIAAAAKEHFNDALILNVYRKNPALDFYQKLGFKVT